jgi:hypothetical protein
MVCSCRYTSRGEAAFHGQWPEIFFAITVRPVYQIVVSYFTQFDDHHLSYSTVLTLKLSRYPYRMIQVTKRIDENKLVVKSDKTSNNCFRKAASINLHKEEHKIV